LRLRTGREAIRHQGNRGLEKAGNLGKGITLPGQMRQRLGTSRSGEVVNRQKEQPVLIAEMRVEIGARNEHFPT
tara:strand:- start:439 stop:660 length:222 start_codon:yes stop_codon:yes gene_type:complete